MATGMIEHRSADEFAVERRDFPNRSAGRSGGSAAAPPAAKQPIVAAPRSERSFSQLSTLDDRSRAVHAMRAMLDRSEAEGRSLTAEEAEEYDRIEGEVARLDSLCEDEARRARLQRAEVRAREPVQSATPRLRLGEHPAPSRGDGGAGPPDLFASAEYRDAFAEALRGRPMRLSNMLAESRDFTTSTTNAPVPKDMDRRIREKLQNPRNLRGLGTVIPADTDMDIPIESGIPTAAVVAENVAATAADPSFDTPITIKSWYIVSAVRITEKMIRSGMDLLAYCERKVTQSVGLKSEEMYAVGSGSSQPKGLVKWVDTANKLVSTTTTNLSSVGGGDYVIDLVHKVSPQYRGNPKFRMLMHDDLVKIVRKIKDSTGAYIWKPAEENSDIREGIPSRVYGVPLVVNQYVPTATGASADPVIVVGDFQFFEIYDRGPVNILIDPYSESLKLNTIVRFFMATDCAFVDKTALAGLRLTA